jgi:oligoribonuclease NrnB/cAMP/cGMP phosphodiesterase (DHH superfamily)
MAGKFDTLKVLNGDLKVKTENSEKINFNFLKSIHRATNVTYQDHHVTRAQRGEILGMF